MSVRNKHVKNVVREVGLCPLSMCVLSLSRSIDRAAGVTFLEHPPSSLEKKICHLVNIVAEAVVELVGLQSPSTSFTKTSFLYPYLSASSPIRSRRVCEQWKKLEPPFSPPTSGPVTPLGVLSGDQQTRRNVRYQSYGHSSPGNTGNRWFKRAAIRHQTIL